MKEPHVIAVCSSPEHTFSKPTVEQINLLSGLGVEGDAHCGTTVKHRSRVKRDPSQPNLRQVHLIHAELFDELAAEAFSVLPGQIGENITTRGLDLLSLPVNTELRIGPAAVVRVTGLRNPCPQLNTFQSGLMDALIDRTPDGERVLKAGVMGVVERGGPVRPGDAIDVKLPDHPHHALARV